MAASRGSSHASGERGRRANGEPSPSNRPAWRRNDRRTVSSCSLGLMPRLYDAEPMTVAARQDNNHARPARPPRAVDFGGGTPDRAGTYPFDGHDVVADWHTHDLHQLE